MVIAINTRHFTKAYQSSYLQFIYQCFNRITKQHPQHSFIFFSQAALDASCHEFANSIFIAVPIKYPGFIAKALYNIKVSSLLKKHSADVIVNADAFCSLLTNTRQCFIASQPYLPVDNFIKKSYQLIYKKIFYYVIKKAKIIVTDSLFSKDELVKDYRADDTKIDIVYHGISNVKEPLSWKEREEIKEQNADGYEYFIFFGNVSQQNILLNLLKGFSHFKKWQKSNMRLLIVSDDSLPEKFTESLKLFKYRNDVRLIHTLPQSGLKKVIAAAYCIIYFPCYADLQLSLFEWISYNVPVITSNAEPLPELYSNAVLYVDFDNSAEIGQKLALIFKDENLRQTLFKNGIERIKHFTWDQSSALLWKSIVKASS